MTKLLVNTPSGAQAVVEVGPGGGYFDESRVIWDERTDGNLPSITLGGMVASGSPGSRVLSFDQSRMDEHTAAIAPPVPQVVTMRQARLALLQAGKLDAVNDALVAMTGAEGVAARIEWDYSSEVQRTRPLVVALGSALSLDLDALFVAAAAL